MTPIKKNERKSNIESSWENADSTKKICLNYILIVECAWICGTIAYHFATTICILFQISCSPIWKWLVLHNWDYSNSVLGESVTVHTTRVFTTSWNQLWKSKADVSSNENIPLLMRTWYSGVTNSLSFVENGITEKRALFSHLVTEKRSCYKCVFYW